MKKFIKTSKVDKSETEMFGADGTIQTVNTNPKTNTNGKKFWNFTAKLDMPRGSMLCLGQVYEGSFEYLGGMPKPGDNFAFATELASLQSKNNKLWNIVGHNVDTISDDLLADIEQMDF